MNTSGDVTLFGRDLQQNLKSILGVDTLLKAMRPKRIIEIGTGSGGLTLLLAIHARLSGGKVLTCDPYDRNFTGEFLGAFHDLPIDYRVQRYEDIQRDAAAFAHQAWPTLTIVDSFGKLPHAVAAAYTLRDGDVLMIHDYLAEEQGGLSAGELDYLMGRFNLSQFNPRGWEGTGWAVVWRPTKDQQNAALPT